MTRLLKIVLFLFMTVMTASAIAQPPVLVKELGLTAGMYYPDAKKRMLHLGWVLGDPKNSKTKYPEAPEAFCVRYAASDMLQGERCFVMFIKNERVVIFHVAHEKESLYVYGFFNEDNSR